MKWINSRSEKPPKTKEVLGRILFGNKWVRRVVKWSEMCNSWVLLSTFENCEEPSAWVELPE